MLPDFPELKVKLLRLLGNYNESRTIELLGPFGQSQRHAHHEGMSWVLQRSDGSEDRSDYQSVSADFEVRRDEVPNYTFQDIIGKVDAVTQEIAMKMLAALTQNMIKATEEVGNVVDAGGQELTQEALLKTIELVEFGFDEEGRHQLQIMTGTDYGERFEKLLRVWGEDPEFKLEWDELMARKRREWNAREASRKLVD